MYRIYVLPIILKYSIFIFHDATAILVIDNSCATAGGFE